MLAELAEVAEVCTWDSTANAAYQTAVNALLNQANIDTVDQVGAATIEALARVEIWRRVVNRFSTAINFSADGVTASQRQLFENAQAMLDRSMDAAQQIGLYGTPKTDIHSSVHPINFVW